eukprot:scaffold2648_cov258-Pinguiococcus_pyrenoidosus.AAC.2
MSTRALLPQHPVAAAAKHWAQMQRSRQSAAQYPLHFQIKVQPFATAKAQPSRLSAGLDRSQIAPEMPNCRLPVHRILTRPGISAAHSGFSIPKHKISLRI